MRPEIRDEAAVARLHGEDGRLLLEFRPVGQVAVHGRADLERFVRHHGTVPVVDHVEELVAVDLGEEVVLGIGVEGRRGVRRRHEDVAFEVREPGIGRVLVAHVPGDTVQHLFEERPVFGHALDPLQDHPGIRLLDEADDLRRRKVDERRRLGLLVDADLAGIVLHAVGWHAGREVDQLLEGEERMSRELVLQREGPARKGGAALAIELDQ